MYLGHVDAQHTSNFFSLHIVPGQRASILLGNLPADLDLILYDATTAQHLRGTPYWPDFEGAIWFFETAEGVPPPETVDAILQDYENMGVLARIVGLVVGRPYNYRDAQKAELREILLERTRGYAFPILADVDFGHTAPQLTLPIGCRAELDIAERRFAVVEAAVNG